MKVCSVKKCEENAPAPNVSLPVRFRSRSLSRWPRPIPKPEIVLAEDLHSSESSRLSPGGILWLLGRDLLVMGEDERTGIFFVNQSDPFDVVHVPSSKLRVNSPGCVSCSVPMSLRRNMTYRIKLCSRASGSSAYLRHDVLVAWSKGGMTVG